MGKPRTAIDLLAADQARSQRSAEARAHPSSAAVNWSSIFGGTPSSSGVSVTPETSLQASAVYGCVAVISGTVSTLPLHVYRRLPGGGRERAVEHPLYGLLHDAPNDLLTSCEWREMMQAHLCLRGNAYAKIVRDAAGVVRALEPVHPDRVSVFQRAGKVTYSVQDVSGPQEVFTPDGMLHVRGLGPDGVVGYSPITLARNAIGLAIATENHGARFFSNGARPSGLLEAPAGITDAQLKMLREEWNRAHAGAENANKMAILNGGMKYVGVSMSNDDAQFLETRKFQTPEIARIFRVPIHKIQDMSGATFSNIEHQAIEFVTDCIRPWAVKWEQRMNVALLTPAERREYFIEYSLDALMRGDTVSRFNSYKVGREGGWLSSNDIRDLENMNRIDGGDTYMQPLNFTRLGQFEQNAPDTPQDEPMVRESVHISVPVSINNPQAGHTVNVPAPVVEVKSAPVVNVPAPVVNVAPPVVNVAAPEVRVENHNVMPEAKRRDPVDMVIDISRDKSGKLTGKMSERRAE